MPRIQSRRKKLAVLEIVKQEKDALFFKFSNSSSKTKEEAWKRVLEVAKSLGVVEDRRDWAYFRDKVFGIWKSRALSKRDKARTGGGKEVQLNEVDEAILDIFGRDSPTVSGPTEPTESINSNPASAPAPSPVPTPASTSAAALADCLYPLPVLAELDVGEDSEEGLLSPPSSKKKRKRRASSKPALSKDALEQELRIEYLELQNFKTKLEILQMQRNLHLKPSQ